MPGRRYKNFDEYSIQHQRRILAWIRDVSSDESNSNNSDVSNSIINSIPNSTTDDDDSNSVNDNAVFNNINNDDDQNIGDADSSNSSFDDDSVVASDESLSSDYSADDSSDNSSENPSENSSNDSSDDEFYDALDETDDRSSSSEDENDDFEINEDPALFPECPLTVSESLLSVLSLTLRYTISGVLLGSILELIKMHCPEPNNCIDSLYKFKKYFEHLKSPVKRHYYCTNCLANLENEKQQCPNCLDQTKVSYFMTMSIISQLRSLYSRRGFREKLNHKFNRVKLAEDNIEDIYDGKIYKELSEEGGILSDPNNISFCWYTDGVQVFHSSKFSFWPLYLVINELSYEERFKKENLILAGMWFGEGKPSPNMFLYPLHDEVEQILNGVEINIADSENPINVKAIIICGSCDLPAKALFLNMIQYNGKYGCHKCKQEGERIGNVQVYPYQRNTTMRTEDETLKEAAQVTSKPIKGVKGPTILAFMVYQWIRSTALDAMHCVFEGVMKALLNLWFSPDFAQMPWSLYKFIDIIDQRLEEIEPPGFVQRRPRSIKKHLPYWKASELKNFFFYFALVILEDIMETDYFEHFKLLVGAIFLLCQKSITEEMIIEASRMLHEFVSRFQYLYGFRYMSCNVHSLLHLPDLVRDLGPLWVYSCFSFEDINGKLKNLVHGSKSAQLQIYNGASLYIGTFTMNKDHLNEGRKAFTFCKKLLCPKKQLKLQEIGDSIYIAGVLSKLPVPEDVLLELERNEILGERYIIFKRLFKNHFVYMSELYKLAKLTNSTCAKYIDLDRNCFGIIKSFMRVTNCLCRKVCEHRAEHYAVLKSCRTEIAYPSTLIPNGLGISYIHKLEIVEEEIKIINVESLLSLCFLISIKDSNSIYAIEPINTIEQE